MKKTALLMAAVLSVGVLFAGCGNSNSSSTTSTNSTASTASTASTTSTVSTAEAGDDNTLTMATNAFFEPYEFYDGDTIVGIDAEVGKAIADKLGMDFEISDTDFDTIIPNVQSGKADIGMAGMTVTEDRKKNVNFTQSYATGIQVVIVPEGSEITSIEDLEGKKIGTQQGTTGWIYCSGDYGEDNVVAYNKGTEAIMALQAGKVDCVVIDNEPAKAFVEANEGLVILDTEYAVEDYAICIAKDNTELLTKVDNALGELIADGTVQSIVDKYISAE